MLTKLRIRNFKRFDAVEIELGSPVVFIGPNNSGKTTALQALAFWQVGLRRWLEKRGGKTTPEKRPGVTINRRDLLSLPVPGANLLWRDLRVRDVQRRNGNPHTQNIRVEIGVEGVDDGELWSCDLEFDYANAESLYCRPKRLNDETLARPAVPPQAERARIVFLPPMSGLLTSELRLEPGAINVRLGEGRTAEVLRNLCFHLAEQPGAAGWKKVSEAMRRLFRVELEPPSYIAERGELEMNYVERGTRLDLSASGRGLQQTLLLLAYLATNPGAILLLDEPDAHLEILRQREIYQLITETARDSGAQIVAASHSEVVLNEATGRDVVVAFLGSPHRIDDRGSHLLKSLREISFDDYYQAEQTGWILYLEGATDLSVLQALARTLQHPAAALLERVFVKYVQDQPTRAAAHFGGVAEAIPAMRGYALFDRLNRDLPARPENLVMHQWARREIENYICTRTALLAWAEAREAGQAGPLFAAASREVTSAAIDEIEAAVATLGKGSPWGPELKVSDDSLDPLFKRYFSRLGLPNLIAKSDYHRLAAHVGAAEIDAEVIRVLDGIQSVARQAQPGERQS